MVWWTGLAPWEFAFPSPGSLTSTINQSSKSNDWLNQPINDLCYEVLGVGLLLSEFGTNDAFQPPPPPLYLSLTHALSLSQIENLRGSEVLSLSLSHTPMSLSHTLSLFLSQIENLCSAEVLGGEADAVSLSLSLSLSLYFSLSLSLSL